MKVRILTDGGYFTSVSKVYVGTVRKAMPHSSCTTLVIINNLSFIIDKEVKILRAKEYLKIKKRRYKNK